MSGSFPVLNLFLHLQSKDAESRTNCVYSSDDRFLFLLIYLAVSFLVRFLLHPGLESEFHFY